MSMQIDIFFLYKGCAGASLLANGVPLVQKKSRCKQRSLEAFVKCPAAVQGMGKRSAPIQTTSGAVIPQYANLFADYALLQ